jgi:hypothetical protein
MAHEHTGNCCNDTHEHQHSHHAVENLGSLCCEGRCNHFEHQLAMNQFLAMSTEPEQLLDKKEEKVKKKKKKKTVNWLGFIPLSAPNTAA